ncbi:hypothetical protein TNCT_502441 [Trichonephila clavata]|uniref:Uncharacterized protein n=1 Tax=Trichonephila clavata TaxID=2740835 RepID=A0A8X6GF74_TRICU|nr:hypothetical protein TNCT_502441 [Trichonephila clavata]
MLSEREKSFSAVRSRNETTFSCTKVVPVGGKKFFGRLLRRQRVVEWIFRLLCCGVGLFCGFVPLEVFWEVPALFAGIPHLPGGCCSGEGWDGHSLSPPRVADPYKKRIVPSATQ